MTFSVEPAALRACAAALGEDSAASRTAKSYTAQHGAMSWHDEGLITTILGSHDDFVGVLAKRLQHLCDLLDASATELNRAADFYQRTDQAAASKADAAYPPVVRPPTRSRGD